MNDTSLEDQDLQRFLKQIVSPDRIQISLPDPRKKVIVISGPTAVGKTQLSLQVARALGGEIISADSMQVYRGMDIGTAKLPLEERQSIPHHLMDIRDLHQTFNVVDFYEEAMQTIQKIHDKGLVPIVVGGTGFYLHALLYGPPSGPPSMASVREQLEKEWDLEGAEALWKRLQVYDAEYARTITKNDKQKIVRALEIIAISGKKVSDFLISSIEPQKYNFRCWFLYMPKEVLYRKIEQRCEEMLAQGFLDEVKALEKQGLRNNSSASQAIGYRQCLEFLSSPQAEPDLDHLISSFKQASRRYAKRQFTWFRKESLFRWIHREEYSLQRAAEVILQDAEAPF
ncbi:MAG: tRNA (adenosine(37)-N6)-dimethylallyltransferase MiaA [Rhabdochlamydiaceae bacterium]|nr:tRNA (adenosine(37)-N6)-dimethylallyltransferase MiaA [Rhabdochlamydiaceae bacterium]